MTCQMKTKIEVSCTHVVVVQSLKYPNKLPWIRTVREKYIGSISLSLFLKLYRDIIDI